MDARPVVQFISKPITAPFRDGTKCLVRDIALHLRDHVPEVLGVRDAEEELPGVRIRRVYGDAGSYSPGLTQNLRAALWTLLRSRADLWHFVFAPNPRSSQVGRILKLLRGVPVVQTVASPPKSFEQCDKLLFGDVVVAQSGDTRDKLIASLSGGRTPRIVEIPPPAPLLAPIDDARVERICGELRVSRETKIVLYPGDVDFSHGAERVGSLAARLDQGPNGPLVVMAYRDKSNLAEPIARALEERLQLPRLRLVRNTSDIHALLAASSVVLFPVEELYGKVDLPIILLEAFRLGVPVLASSVGPLGSLEGAKRLKWDPELWTEELTRILGDETVSRSIAAEASAALHRYEPAAVARSYESVYAELLETTR